MRAAIVALAILCSSAPAAAEENPFRLAHGRRVADRLSGVFVGANIAGETIASLRSANRSHALKCQGIRTAIAIGGAEIVKHLVHRTRPDGSDRLSFPSGHTWLGFANSTWTPRLSVSFAIGAGALRPMADKHYATDVLAGAGAGWLTRQVCR